MKIEIKCRFDGHVIFAHDAESNTIRLTAEAAVSARANLDGANLARANLAGAYLDGAYLDGAYLDGANLAHANLAGAYLDGAYLDGEKLTKAPLSLLNLKWSVLITGRYLRIGCKRHTHDEWAAFNDGDISEMAAGALEFWRDWKGALMALCAQYHEEPQAMDTTTADTSL